MSLSLIDETEEDPDSDDLVKTIHHRTERVTSFSLPSAIVYRYTIYMMQHTSILKNLFDLLLLYSLPLLRCPSIMGVMLVVTNVGISPKSPRLLFLEENRE